MPRLTRFTCTKCERRYEVPPALAGLPLLCKGCGTPLTVPDPPDEPEPEPEPPPPPKPKAKVAPPVAQAPRIVATPKSAPPPDEEEDDKPFLIPEPEGGAVPVATAASRSEANGPPAGPAPGPNRVPVAPKAAATKPAVAKQVTAKPAPAAVGRKLIAAVVDAAVGLVLLAGGVLAGEILARKPTRQVWNDAGGAVSFPPVELLMWAGPPLLILLVYVLLLSRGVTIGGWLRRRAAA